MRISQLPDGVRARKANETLREGEIAVALGPDLRIFKATHRVRAPYSVQARIGAEWRDLLFSRGQGRRAAGTFMTLTAALNRAQPMQDTSTAVQAMSEAEASALAARIDAESGEPGGERAILIECDNSTFAIGFKGAEFTSPDEWRAWYEWTPDWAEGE